MCYLRISVRQLAHLPGFDVTHIPKGNLFVVVADTSALISTDLMIGAQRFKLSHTSASVRAREEI